MNLNAINEIRSYLKSWMEQGKYPKSFKNIEFNKESRGNLLDIVISLCTLDHIVDEVRESEQLEDETVVYILGLYLYNILTKERYGGELSHRGIKRPRVYQFLKAVLETDKHDRVKDPSYLLIILTSRSRDTLFGDTKETKNCKIEPFSTIGLTRHQNQDYVKYCECDDGAIVLIVADGVGGAEDGEVASKLATDFIIDSLKKYPFENESEENIENLLRDLLFESNQRILKYADDKDIDKIGTTLSLALIVKQSNLFIAHIGDSRIYEWKSGGKLKQLTEDHSYPEVLFRKGKITEEEKKDYKKNILVYVLGKDNLKKENIFIHRSYIFDKSLLLCTDGLWDTIKITEETFKKPLEELKEEIFDAVPTDNVSLIRYFPIDCDDENLYEDNMYYDIDTEVPSIEDIAPTDYPAVQNEKEETQDFSIVEKRNRYQNIEKNSNKMIKILFGVAIVLLLILATILLFNDGIKQKTQPVLQDKTNSQNHIIETSNIDNIDELNKTSNNTNINRLFDAYKSLNTKEFELLIQEGVKPDDKIKTAMENDIKQMEEKLKKLKTMNDMIKNIKPQ